MDKWNVVYNKTIAGTVSQEKVDQYRKYFEEHQDRSLAIWHIQLNVESSDADIATYLMLEHETLEEEDLEIEIEDVSKI